MEKYGEHQYGLTYTFDIKVSTPDIGTAERSIRFEAAMKVEVQLEKRLKRFIEFLICELWGRNHLKFFL